MMFLLGDRSVYIAIANSNNNILIYIIETILKFKIFFMQIRTNTTRVVVTVARHGWMTRIWKYFIPPFRGVHDAVFVEISDRYWEVILRWVWNVARCSRIMIGGSASWSARRRCMYFPLPFGMTSFRINRKMQNATSSKRRIFPLSSYNYLPQNTIILSKNRRCDTQYSVIRSNTRWF